MGKTMKKAARSQQAVKKQKIREPGPKQGSSKKQAVKGKASGKGKETVNDKPRMLGCLDIDFSYWNAADIARQWNALANKDAGTATTGRKRKAPGASHPGLEVAVYEEAGLSGSQQAGEAGRAPGTMDLAEAGALTNNALLPFEMWLSTSAMHPLACEEAALGLSVLRQCCEAASAITGRRNVAIPPDELAQLGLDSCSNKDEQNKAPKQTRLFWGGEELVDVGGKRFYPKRLVREENDMAVREWMKKEEEGTLPSGDYKVTAIVDERKRPNGRTLEFLVKWKGFELNPDQWLPLKQLQDCKAMEDWAHKRAVDGQWHASSHAEWSHQSAQADRRTDGKCKKK